MNWMSRRGAIAVVIANFIGFVLAFEPAGAQAPKADQRGPVIFAAASMKTALDAIAAAWASQERKPAVISYASSAVLAKQIEQGAPADVFISANLEWMDHLDKARLLKAGTRRNLLGNQLVLVKSADAETRLKIETGFDLAGAAGDGRIAVCTIAACPAGFMRSKLWRSSGFGPPSSRNWRRRTISAMLQRWLRAVRQNSASCTLPMPRLNRKSEWSMSFQPRRTRRSSIPPQ